METTIQYLAGLFDGEGCISIIRANVKSKNERARSPAYELKLHIRMTDPRPIKVFRDFFDTKKGGYVVRQEYKPLNHRPTYCFGCSHTKAETIIKQLLPYLICKKEQAELAIEFQQYIRDSKCQGKIGFSRKPVPDYILAKRHDYYLTMRKLKLIRLPL